MSMLTIDDLMKSNKTLETHEKDTLKVKLKELDKEIEINKISKVEFLEILDTKSNVPTDNITIYTACPLFKNETLIEKLNCKDNPYNVVSKCLSAKSIYALAKKILIFSGLDLDNADGLVEDVATEVKN